MQSISFNRALACAIAITALLACGGASESDDTTKGGAGSTATTSGGSLGMGGTASLGGNASTGGVCCNMRAYCYDGDTELPTGATCPAGTTCYTQPAVCCSPSVTCAQGNGGASPEAGGAGAGGAGTGGTRMVGNGGTSAGLGGWSWDTPSEPIGGACSAPSCAAGYSLVGTGCTVSTPNPCYSMDECGGGLVCQKTSITCDRAAEYNRRYQLADTTLCETTTLTCVTNTTAFKSACGCGCEQASGCPEWFDCMPGGTLDPACSDSTICPFSGRAL
jgi:hypothetical protein